MPERFRDGWLQASAGTRVAGGKQGHLMPAPDKLLGEGADHALGASIPRRGDTFKRWGKLCDPHALPPCGARGVPRCYDLSLRRYRKFYFVVENNSPSKRTAGHRQLISTP